MFKHRLWVQEHWYLCPLLHCSGTRPRLTSCLYVPILLKLKWLSESVQEEILLQQLPPMANSVKTFLFRGFCPLVGFRPFEAIFQVYEYLFLPPFNEHHVPMKIIVDSRAGKEWVLRQKPIPCLDYGYNYSLNLLSVTSCGYIRVHFQSLTGLCSSWNHLVPGLRLLASLD